MPRMRKDEVDKIRALIAEGLTIVEIRERTGASESYIGKLKREMSQSGTGSTPSIIQLSEKSQRYLLLMQTAMGLKDINTAVDQIYSDFLLINSKKVRFDPNNEKSISAVFLQLLKELDEKMNIDEVIHRMRNNVNFREDFLKRLGLSEVINLYYADLMALSNSYKGTIFEFINDKIRENFINKGWKLENL
jgi:hypothetical protein